MRNVPSYQPPYIWVATLPATTDWIFSSHFAAEMVPVSLSFFIVSSVETQAGWLIVISLPSSEK